MPIPRRLVPLIEHWHSALAEPFGIVLRTNNPKGLVNELYRARTAACDPALQALSVCRSPRDASEIWIVRREPETPTPAEPET